MKDVGKPGSQKKEGNYYYYYFLITREYSALAGTNSVISSRPEDEKGKG